MTMTIFDKIFNMFKKTPNDQVQPFVIASRAPDVGRIEQSSPTWVFINQWAHAELEAIRKRNDNLLASDQQTIIYRAEIRLLKKIISMPKDVDAKRDNKGSDLINNRAGYPPQY